jgi:hypothetical protein
MLFMGISEPTQKMKSGWKKCPEPHCSGSMKRALWRSDSARQRKAKTKDLAVLNAMPPNLGGKAI